MLIAQMKTRYLLGSLAITLGIFWIMLVTSFMIANVLPVALQAPEQWAQQIYLPSASLSTVVYLGFLLAWIYYSFNKRCKNCLEAKQTLGLWLTLFGMSIFSNIVSLILFIQFTVVQATASQAAPGGTLVVNAPPYEFLVPLTLLNGLLLFWLPSCFLSQRTLRFIPPFSYELNTISEKR